MGRQWSGESGLRAARTGMSFENFEVQWMNQWELSHLVWTGFGGYTLALRAPPSTGATQVRGTGFPSIVQCRQCVRCFSLCWHWHLALAAGLAATTLLSALTTTPYPDNCAAPAGRGRASWTLALSLSFSLLLHHPSSPLWLPSQISISLFWGGGGGHAKSGR